jgi:hypothetical protein
MDEKILKGWQTRMPIGDTTTPERLVKVTCIEDKEQIS